MFRLKGVIVAPLNYQPEKIPVMSTGNKDSNESIEEFKKRMKNRGEYKGG